MTNLSGRGAIVTGGFSGMGLAIATTLAQAGANVAVGSYVAPGGVERSDAAYYPGADEIERVRSALGAHGTRIYAAHLDVRDSGVTNRFAADAEAAVGPVDILVNAAGTTAEQPVCGHSDALWDKIVDTNLTGAFRATRAVLPGMIERGWGRIVNIGSTAASVGWKDNPAYCASKAGLLGLTRCVALEGAAHGVTCVMISPTWVETELMRRNVAQVVEREGKGRTAEDAMAEIARGNPQQRILQPQEIAALAVFLCSDMAKGITMENIQVTGGALW
ncbi:MULTISPECIES: SDR family NAD(P)-dependent oxidoreductase [unclassified Mesorhizobium]|uniref:SDR family NAD(P)-dependent oxidoreductase n=1 Tax=unclassified Mesorhizobium TaxID=325217 RepID=UPI001128DC53|nr:MULTISPECIES: SDR family NAD(P)-dependent oxidoreductase [unclassified Mesorhizobium]TPJ56457.1 SDR family oxidoreductase [Mesorhizobium sp. B2-6-4]TPJ63770.1 SDR family oxidoreductase [Mesorhizobium sp. B2-6-1]TPK54199.1 SDR family oxidoreductase [Mesorhizobium sp. B2-5-2]TPL25366.1 SDR family oxidoreductase [Mesorhizobium sp. B2-4-7]TPL29312.1 SDR family oxidoreductase [Mesorhizobium sp. B2-4-9]